MLAAGGARGAAAATSRGEAAAMSSRGGGGGAAAAAGGVAAGMESEKDKNSRLQAIWQHLDRATATWEKRKPVVSAIGIFIVKAFHPDASAAENKTLPYQLEPAGAALDLWAYGAMLFHLLFREPLVHVNPDEDLVADADVLRAATWTNKQLANRIDSQAHKVDNIYATNLLKKLLCGRECRLPSMDHLLFHPFFIQNNSPFIEYVVERDMVSLDYRVAIIENMKAFRKLNSSIGAWHLDETILPTLEQLLRLVQGELESSITDTLARYHKDGEEMEGRIKEEEGRYNRVQRHIVLDMVIDVEKDKFEEFNRLLADLNQEVCEAHPSCNEPNGKPKQQRKAHEGPRLPCEDIMQLFQNASRLKRFFDKVICFQLN